MITLTTEQAQLIEDALENWFAQTPDTSHLDIKLFVLDTKQALSIIRAARAQEQSEQEPVGFGVMAFGELQQSSVHYEAMLEAAKAKQDSGLWDDVEVVELYTHPVRIKDPCHPWQDLTDDEIWSKGSQVRLTGGGIKKGLINYARAVIAADREKNK